MAKTIDQFIDGLSEDWMRSVFVDRLENARLLVDDDTFGDKVGANDAVAAFLQLSTSERLAEVERLRIRNIVTQWAKTATKDAINSLVTILRTIRDIDPEIGVTGETGESGEIGETGVIEETSETGE